MKQLRIGVVGLGLGRIHARAYDQSEAIKTIVLCDPDQDRLNAVKGSLSKASKCYQDVTEMFDAEDLDAVSIVSPDHLHRAQAEAAFSAGCHVLLTKPLATNLDDARAIIRQSESSGRKLMVAQENRFHTREQRIKAILESGDLGEIIHLRVDSFHYKRQQFQRSPWYASTESGRTAMVGTGIHEVDLIRYLTDKRINRVFAYGNRLGTLEFHGNKTVAALFELVGGTIAQVTVTYVSRPDAHPDSFVLLGTKGMISGDLVIRDGHEVPEELPKDEQPVVTGTYECVSRFVTAVAGDTLVPVTGRDAFASLAACVAADESCFKTEAISPASDLFK